MKKISFNFVRFAVVLKQLGFQRKDVAHILLGNHNWAYSAAFGCWILGGIASMGDVNPEPKSVARQVFRYSSMNG